MNATVLIIRSVVNPTESYKRAWIFEYTVYRGK